MRFVAVVSIIIETLDILSEQNNPFDNLKFDATCPTKTNSKS